MSQTYDPNYPGNDDGPQGRQGDRAGSGYPGGPGGPYSYGGYGYAMQPPPPPRRSHKRGLAITGVVALAAGAAVGGAIGSLNSGSSGNATATSKTVLSASQIASRVDPALVDVVSTDGYQGALSEGTGIVLSANGLVLTNNHVIEGGTSIKVTDIGNGKTYTATPVGYDATQDVAVLQLQGASGLTVASLGNSSTVAVGDSVVALGNAGGKGGTPSEVTGTVTALNQSITASDELSGVNEHLKGMIEDNADIQPGDSGGSLVNSYGQVIGMDTAASSNYQLQPSSSSSGSGAAEQAYAIPINEAMTIAKQIEAHTTSADVHIGATAFLGIEVSTQSSNSGSSGDGGFGGYGYGYGGLGGSAGTTSGVTVAGVLNGTPAAQAGLAEGDVITALGGHSVSTAEDITQTLVPYHPGQKISITWVNTAGQSQTATITLATGPAA
jgi:S1-C subfamily serine protease